MHRGAAEVAGEGGGVQRGAHEHHPQAGAVRQAVSQQDQQEVAVQAALVHLCGGGSGAEQSAVRLTAVRWLPVRGDRPRGARRLR